MAFLLRSPRQDKSIYILKIVISTVEALIFLASSLVGLIAYSYLFPAILNMKYIRHEAEFERDTIWLVSVVVLVASTSIITFTAIFTIFFDREISGRFFYIASVLGAILVTISSIFMGFDLRPPRGLEFYFFGGLFAGYIIVFVSNIIAYFSDAPSLL